MNEPYGRGGTLYVRKFNLDASDYARFVCEMRHQGYVTTTVYRKGTVMSMCDVCMQTPCDYRCPNAALAQPVLLCECCGGEIYEGEIYYECVDGMDLCEACFDRWREQHYKEAETEG